MQPTIGVGIIGTGNIVGQYLDQLAHQPSTEVVAVADAVTARAEAVASERGLRALGVAELLADEAVDVVLNLTTPPVHAELNLAAIGAGKHVYCEKPFALGLAEGLAVLAAAGQAGLRVGCAPDTFLGVGLQTTLDALQAGEIGQPFAASAFWGSPGHERWHPDPQFFYLAGGGPVLDLGPYYLTALVVHLGPVVRVQACTTTTERPRHVWSGPLEGQPIKVAVPTHATAILEHQGGAKSSVTLSYELWAHSNTGLEIYGTEGTLRLPDPNRFADPVWLWQATGAQEWVERGFTAGFDGAGRGIGVAEMGRAIAVGRPHRASGELAVHVLDVMTAIEASGREARAIELTTTVTPPPLVPGGTDVACE